VLTVKQRAAISAGTWICIVLALALWPMPEFTTADRPSTWILVIATTWFGPTLLFAFPLLLLWMSFGAETREGATLGIGISMGAFVLCLAVISFARSVVQAHYGPYSLSDFATYLPQYA